VLAPNDDDHPLGQRLKLPAQRLVELLVTVPGRDQIQAIGVKGEMGHRQEEGEGDPHHRGQDNGERVPKGHAHEKPGHVLDAGLHRRQDAPAYAVRQRRCPPVGRRLVALAPRYHGALPAKANDQRKCCTLGDWMQRAGRRLHTDTDAIFDRIRSSGYACFAFCSVKRFGGDVRDGKFFCAAFQLGR